jgi:hypothetical protein
MGNRIIGNTGINDRLINQTTIRGSGQIGADSLAFDNWGTIVATNAAVRLYIDTGNSLATSWRRRTARG